MKILKDVSLKLYSTMRLGGTADYLTEARTRDDLAKAETWAETQNVPIRVIGSGSNIIWRDEGYKGLLVINRIRGFEQIAEDGQTATFRIGAGENWDTIVDQLVGLKLSGIESLSLIPGTVGAAPVQNIGAYGQDISQTLVELEAYDRMEKGFVTLSNEACAFGYRTSRFKTIDQGRFLISSVTLRLKKTRVGLPKYADIEAYFTEHDITEYTPATIRKAVVAIRSKKLPDPNKIANCGSFFANPIIPADEFIAITKKHPELKKPHKGWSQAPYWILNDDTVKLSAGRLIEEAGFSAHKDPTTGMRLWPSQNLVFVNDKAKSTQDLLDFERKIADAVMEKFGVELQREPEILP
jgi:UDP-N-acetylmuramate dehydrogenase